MRLEPFDEEAKKMLSDREMFGPDNLPIGIRWKVPGMGNIGYVALLDVMGDDQAIVDAARTSYQKGTRSVSDNRGLIRYLFRHEHMTPFEMVELKFVAKYPIFVERQWVRHRTASINGESLRYSEAEPEQWVPDVEALCTQDTKNRQGRTNEIVDEAEKLRTLMANHAKVTFQLYQNLIAAGVAREVARTVLPLGQYTKWVWKVNLRNFLHFSGLRLDPHAQAEIRAYAEVMYELVRFVAPMACEAFEDFEFKGMRFSRLEKEILRRQFLEHNVPESNVKQAERLSDGLLQMNKLDGTPLKSGEGPEFITKMKKLLK